MSRTEEDRDKSRRITTIMACLLQVTSLTSKTSAEGKHADRKDDGTYKKNETYLIVKISLPNLGLQQNLVRT